MDEPTIPENRFSINGAGTAAEWRAFITECGLMPVPRCDQCKHWLKKDSLYGECLRPREQRPDTKMWAELYDGIMTAPDFGCVQFLAKP